MQTKKRAKGKLGLRQRKICFDLGMKCITMQFDLFRECFFHNSALLVVEDFLIWTAVGAIVRFRCDTKSTVERNVELCENFTQVSKQVFIANNSVDDDLAPRAIQVPKIINGKSPASEVLL